MTGLRDRLIDTGHAAGWRLAQALPAPLLRHTLSAAAPLLARRGPGRRLRGNLARLVPAHRLEHTLRQGLRSYARYWAETLHPPGPAALSRVAVTGAGHLDAARAAGRGVVLALSHSGNWDVAGAWLARRTGGLTTVAERLQPESRYRRFTALRTALGIEVLPLTGGPPPGRTLLNRLRGNGTVGLLADRVLTGPGLPVTLCGEPARLPAGPARLATATGATLLPVATWFTADGWGLRVHPPLPVTTAAETTQRLAEVLAADLAAHPADWHMLHPVWTADR